MPNDITKEQHTELKKHVLNIIREASKIQSIIEDDDGLLVIASMFFSTSIKFSEEMIRRGYGND